MRKASIILFILISLANFTQAKIKLSSVIGDNMVLQRNSEVRIWGFASANEVISVTTSWNKTHYKTTTSEDGKWLISVKTSDAGGPYHIDISGKKEKITVNNVLLGEVWLCSGQSNMEMPVKGFNDSPVNGAFDVLLNAENSSIRMFTVQRATTDNVQDSCQGEWQMANAGSVSNFSAVGYFYARQLQQTLHVPVGVVCSSWGGSRIEAWINQETMANYPEALALTSKPTTPGHHKAAHLFNGMIYPIKNLVIKGAIWYQGESNRSEYNQYAALMEAMVGSWRKEFGVGEFPFYFVQIAPFKYNNAKDSLSALFCNEQLKASQIIPNCGMVITTDIGELNNIHPAEKETISKRLVCWALAETYGFNDIQHENPTVKEITANDSTLVLTFEHAPMGMTTFGKQLTDFEVAGRDQHFYPANAYVRTGKTQVVVWSDSVKQPLSVRYRYCNYPKGTGYLYNTYGFPVPSFQAKIKE